MLTNPSFVNSVKAPVKRALTHRRTQSIPQKVIHTFSSKNHSNKTQLPIHARLGIFFPSKINALYTIQAFRFSSNLLNIKIHQKPIEIKSTVIWPELFEIGDSRKINKHTEELKKDETILNWAMEMELLTKDDINSFKKHNLEELAGYFHPHCDKEGLILSSKLNVILYSCDNELDNGADKISKDYEAMTKRAKNIKAILKKTPDFVCESPLEKAICSFLKDVEVLEGDKSFFIASMMRYINSTIESLERRLGYTTPYNEEGTPLLRNDVSAVDTVTELGFLLHDTVISEEQRNNTVFRKLMILTNRIVSRINDISSYSREREENNPDNPIIAKEKVLYEIDSNRENAIKVAVDSARIELNNLLGEFSNLASKYGKTKSLNIDFEPKEFYKIASLLRDCIVGGWYWHKDMLEDGKRYTKSNDFMGKMWE